MNLLLIDDSINDLETFVNGCNINTKVITYNSNDTFVYLQDKINQLNIQSFEYLGFVFHDEGNDGIFKRFIENINFISIDENNQIKENETTIFIKSIVNTYNVKTIDFLACDLLNYVYWKLFFEYLQNQSLNENLIIRASNNSSGNLQHGGDWILETTNENIKNLYFNENINYWTYLLGYLAQTNVLLTNEETDNVYTTGLSRFPYITLRNNYNYTNTEYLFEKNIIACASSYTSLGLLTDESMNNFYIIGTGSLGFNTTQILEISNVLINIENKKIISVHFNKVTTSPNIFILTDEPINNLYSCGSGLLGLGNITTTNTFQRVTSLNQKVLMVSGGPDILKLITDEPSNNVYYLDNTTNNIFLKLNDPTLIDKKAIHINTKNEYSSILTDEPINNFYIRGTNSNGGLGLGTTYTVNVYTRVSDYSSELLNKRIVNVYIDKIEHNTFVLTDETSNNLYASGSKAAGIGNGLSNNKTFLKVSDYSSELLNKNIIYVAHNMRGNISVLTSEPSNNLYAIGIANDNTQHNGLSYSVGTAYYVTRFTNISNNASIIVNELINKRVKLITDYGFDYSIAITDDNPTLISNLYICGNLTKTVSALISNSFKRFKQINPPTYKKFIHAAFSSFGIYLISNEINNNLYFCGENPSFNNGITIPILTNISLIQPELLNKKVLNVSTNNNNNRVYVITSEETDNLYASNNLNIPFGNGTINPSFNFIKINNNIENKKILHISTKHAITALLTDDPSNNYYVCGNPVTGAYGDGIVGATYLVFTNIVTPEISGKRFVYVEIGQQSTNIYRTYLISDETENNLYACGSDSIFATLKGNSIQRTFFNINNLSNNLLNKKVVKVSCGASHTGIITNEASSNLYMTGASPMSGFNSSASIFTQPTNDLFQNKQIIDINCNGPSTTMITTNDTSNNVYVFGNNGTGQLGIGNLINTHEPTLPYELNKTANIYVNNKVLNNDYSIVNLTEVNSSNNVKYTPKNINIGNNNLKYFPDFTRSKIFIRPLPRMNAIANYGSTLNVFSNDNVSAYIKLEPAGTRFENHISMDIDVEIDINPIVYFKSSDDLVPQLIPSTNTSSDDVYYIYNSSTGTITLYTKHFSEAIVTQDTVTGGETTGGTGGGTGEQTTGGTGGETTGETGGETTGETGEETTGGTGGENLIPIDFNLDYLNVMIAMNAKGDLFESDIPSLLRDAIAEYYVTANDMRRIFLFQTDSDDIDNITNSTDIKYFVRTSEWPNGLILNPCNAWVNSLQQIAENDKQGVINDDRELVKHDFIRYIAKTLFNTHLAVDLFDNESELVYDLSYKGKVAWDNIWNALSEISDISLNTTLYDGMYGVDVSYGYYLTGDASGNKNISHQLLRQIISNAPSRLQNLNNYVIDSNKGIFSIPLISGDSISFKLTLYTSPNQHTIVNSSTPIPPRTYQIRINLKENVSKSNIHADGVNVIVTDIPPTLYNNVAVEDDLNNSFPSNY